VWSSGSIKGWADQGGGATLGLKRPSKWGLTHLSEKKKRENKGKEKKVR